VGSLAFRAAGIRRAHARAAGLLALAAWIAPAAAAWARAPTETERPAIERVLRVMGIVAWDEIDLDADVWEVHGARTADGRLVGLLLEPDTARLVGVREEEARRADVVRPAQAPAPHWANERRSTRPAAGRR
jgi:hypothetical protein